MHLAFGALPAPFKLTLALDDAPRIHLRALERRGCGCHVCLRFVHCDPQRIGGRQRVLTRALRGSEFRAQRKKLGAPA